MTTYRMFEPCRAGDCYDCAEELGFYSCSCDCHVEDEPHPSELEDGCDHQCGECGRGLPSYQRDGSICDRCEAEVADLEAWRAR